jgi:hypothetical protein
VGEPIFVNFAVGGCKRWGEEHDGKNYYNSSVGYPGYISSLFMGNIMLSWLYMNIVLIFCVTINIYIYDHVIVSIMYECVNLTCRVSTNHTFLFSNSYIFSLLGELMQ